MYNWDSRRENKGGGEVINEIIFLILQTERYPVSKWKGFTAYTMGENKFTAVYYEIQNMQDREMILPVSCDTETDT